MVPVLVLALLVGVGWLTGYGVGRGVGLVRDAWPDAAPALVADKVAAPEPAAVGGPSQPCPATSLTLVATPSTTSVQPGAPVSFDLSITNAGRRPCLVRGGEASRQLVIADAAGTTVWSSAHCGATTRDLLLGPGDVRPDTMRWNGRSSAAGACTTGQETVAPGTYTARLVMPDVPGASSAPVTITVEAPPPPPEPAPAETETQPPATETQPPATETQPPAAETPSPSDAQADADQPPPDQIAD